MKHKRWRDAILAGHFNEHYTHGVETAVLIRLTKLWGGNDNVSFDSRNR